MRRPSNQPWGRSILRPLAATIVVVASSLVLARATNAQTVELEGPNEQIASPVMPISDSGAYAAVKQLPESIRSSAPFAREYYEFERRAGSSGVFDYEAYFAAYRQAQHDWQRETQAAFKNSSPRILASWTNIGINSGGAARSAGCTVDITFDPTNSNVMYAGGQGGGVWKSIDHGASWAPLTDYYLPNMTVASIAIDPHNPSTLWVGTGDCNPGEPNYSGSGLWRSKDGGQSWEQVKVLSAGPSFVKVLVDPSNSSVILASSYDGGRGLYRSEDGGATWSKVHSSGFTWDVVAGKVENGTQTFFLIDGNSSAAGVYKSVDDGKTWTKVDMSNFPAPSDIGRSVLAVASGAQDKVFALMSTANGGDDLGMMVSADAGTSWTVKPMPASSVFKGDLPGFLAQGWYDICLAVHPTGSPIYIGGVQAFADYGKGWEVFSGYSDALPKTAPHVDHHVLAVDPSNPGIVFNGNDGGLYRSDDAGHSWSYASTGMVTNRFYHIGFERINQSAVWGGAQDQGTWRMNVGDDTAFFGGDGMQPIPSPLSSSQVYYELPFGELHVSQDYHSSGGPPITSNDICGDQSPWDAPVKMSVVGHSGGNGSDLIYLGRQNLWRTTDGSKFNKVAGISSTVSAIGLSPASSDVIVVGAGGKIMLSTNFGTSWTTRSTGVSGQPSSIEMTGQNPQFILASTRGPGGVYVSSNLGSSWTKVNGVAGSALPGTNVECVALDSVSPTTTWYAATDVGVYFTTDAGQHWTFSTGLPIVACRDIQIRRDGTVIRVATFGRGVWQSQLPMAVEFTSLKATKTDNGTILSWNTIGDGSTRSFEVERSIGDESFVTIGHVDAAGNTALSYSDPTTRSGAYMYRIASVDESGVRHYSNMVELTYGSNALIVHDPRPNPSMRGSQVSFSYELPTREPVTVSIYNATGVRIADIGTRSIDEPGLYSEEWDGHDASGNLMPAGVYFYHIEAGDLGNYTGRIVIQ